MGAALRRAEFMTSDKANSVKLSFTKNNLTIMAHTPDMGETRASSAVNCKGKDFAGARFIPILPTPSYRNDFSASPT